jgi:molybdate-binding protein/transcriptional regulator with XRE-family HTH domain
MSKMRQRTNQVKIRRVERGWSQADLAVRAGVSRAAVSAIEINRLIPSVAAALALASVFGCSVEHLFGSTDVDRTEPDWAWPPEQHPCRYWHALVNGRTLLFPTEVQPTGSVGHDGVFREGILAPSSRIAPEATLVMACCDPAAALLADEVARSSGFRLLVLPRSSRRALMLLGQGLVHVAGVHLATKQNPDGNARTVRETLGAGYRLLRVARWEEGLSVATGSGVRTVRSALQANLRWVGREPGSAARQCLDEILANRPAPRRLARDHRGVAEAVRSGWADIGVCLRLACEEAGLHFLPVRVEDYDLCIPQTIETDPRIQALIHGVRAHSYRTLLGDLPGVDATATGDIASVN